MVRATATALALLLTLLLTLTFSPANATGAGAILESARPCPACGCAVVPRDAPRFGAWRLEPPQVDVFDLGPSLVTEGSTLEVWPPYPRLDW